jgi:hypothetical protein
VGRKSSFGAPFGTGVYLIGNSMQLEASIYGIPALREIQRRALISVSTPISRFRQMKMVR